MKKMVRAVLFAVMAVFSTAVFAQKVPCAMPANLTEIEGVYQIGTCGDLYKFAEMVNGGETGIKGRLTADIVVNVGVLTSDGTLSGTNFTQWTPIGTLPTPYAGTFDGAGHVISGLYFSDEDADVVGLFGCISNGAVQNVGVVDSYIRGARTVGGVVGTNMNGTVSNVYNTGAVSGYGYVGGVVGENAGNVRVVYNAGAVSGVVHIGGVVGENAGDVRMVYNTGAVSGDRYVGGVVGENMEGTVENAYYNTDSYTGSAVGECDGECEYENVEGKTTAELASTTLPAGFSSEIWNAGSGEPVGSNGKLLYKLPGLKDVGTQPEIEYTGFQPNADGYYEISNALELKCFAQLVNSGATSIKGRLTADICLNACGEGESVLKADGTLNEADTSKFVKWTPIGTAEKPYKGIFDGMGAEGNAHVISGLYFSDENVVYVGLFGYIGNDALVQNVGMEDSYIRGAGRVGGVVGSNAGGFIINVYNTGAVSGKHRVGGVVGYNDGDLIYVYNTGAVSGKFYVGGVVGYIEAGVVGNVYNTGAVSGENWVGGVVGYNDGTVKNAYYNTDFYTGNAIGENGGGKVFTAEGKLTAELIAIDLGPDWVAGNLAYDKTTGKLTASFPYLEIFADFQYKITALEFKVVDNVIQIANADDLENFARLVSEFGVTDVDAELTADICLNACGEGESVLKADGTLDVADASKFVKWTPIGTKDNPYIGTFDGQGHTVSGLYFNDDQMHYVGFFGYVGSGDETKGVVKNVGVVNSYIKGYVEVGGVVGYNQGIVSNSYNASAVNGKNQYVGGVVGYNDKGTVSNSYNTGAVSGNSHVVGGVVGYNISGTVGNSYNAGPVYCGGQYFGGVVGFNMKGEVRNAYYNEDVFKSDAIGGADETATATNVGGKTSAELAAGTDVVLDADFWVLGGVGVGTTNDSLYYPYLKVFGPHKYVLGDVKKYAITVAVNDKTMGTVTGAGTYEYGTDVEIKAVANEGYKFTDWEDDVNTAVRTITVTKAETYTANFEAIPSSSSEVESSSSVDESSSSEAASSSSEAKSSSSEVESSSSEAASSSSEAKSSSSDAESSSSEAASSCSEAKSSSSEAKSSSSSAKSSSSSAKSSSSEAKSSSSEAKSSSSEAESSSSDAKSSSSQKESIIAQAQLPQFSVTASGKMVSIAGVRPNTIVNVFDMQGNMVKTVVATSANFTFALPSAGVYIVKNGYTAKRVNVR